MGAGMGAPGSSPSQVNCAGGLPQGVSLNPGPLNPLVCTYLSGPTKLSTNAAGFTRAFGTLLAGHQAVVLKGDPRKRNGYLGTPGMPAIFEVHVPTVPSI